MKRSKSNFIQFFTVLAFVAILFGFSKNATVNSKFDIASEAYGKLSEKYLQHLANFEWDASFSYLAEDVVFKLPDGDTDTRTSIKGLDKVKEFWKSYQEKSGNNKAAFKDFVHVPVRVNERIDFVEVTGVFDICYFSAELIYGGEKANVRMHWAFHFNDEKKIDGIFTYYDRNPIIEAARKNFLAKTNQPKTEDQTIQVIKIKSELSEDELLKIARGRAEKFRAIPGLLQKYYIRLNEPGYYGGVYVWDSKASMMEFKNSELAAGIAKAYQIVDAPNVEISDVLFQLRE